MTASRPPPVGSIYRPMKRTSRPVWPVDDVGVTDVPRGPTIDRIEMEDRVLVLQVRDSFLEPGSGRNRIRWWRVQILTPRGHVGWCLYAQDRDEIVCGQDRDEIVCGKDDEETAACR